MDKKHPKSIGSAVNDTRWKNASGRQILDLISEYNNDNKWYNPNDWEYSYSEEGTNKIMQDAMKDAQSRMD